MKGNTLNAGSDEAESSPVFGSKEKVATYFLYMEVRNVRCFGPNQTLNLSDDPGSPSKWTVILGDNGVGKTTLLQCLALLVMEYPDRSTVEPDPGESAEWFKRRNVLSDLAPKVSIPIGMSGLDLRGRPDTTSSLLSREDFLIDGELVSGPLFKSSCARVHDSIKLSWLSDEAFFRETSPRPLGSIGCYGYGAARRMGRPLLVESVPGIAGHIFFATSLFEDEVPLINAEEWLLQADYSASKESPVREIQAKRRDQIRRVLIDILPDVDDIVFTTPSEQLPSPGVRFRTPYGLVSLRNLSLGYKTLIAWMVDFASRMFDRYPNSPNPLAEPAIVLVDEIDLHLHPRWQRSLIGFLSKRFPNTQFIVTAHSPLVVQAASEANVVLLRREGDHVVIDNRPEKVRNWRVDQVLTSDLFGLESARPPEIDSLLEKRTELLSKGKLSKQDQSKLREIERQIGPLPAGDRIADANAMGVIHRAAELLKKRAQ